MLIMKVLIYTYDTAFQNKAGGVHNRIDRTVESLRRSGLVVDYFNPFFTNIADYDVLHIFKLDSSALAIANYARLKGLKVVVSTIVTLEKGWLTNLYWYMQKIPFSTLYKQTFKLCDIASALVVETPAEALFVQKYYHVPQNKIRIIPNGADDLTENILNDFIFEKIGGPKKFALVVARFDENKNQINLIRALKKTNIDLVFIGGPDANHVKYYNDCVKEAENSQFIHFLGWQDSRSELLKSAYAHATAIVCPSFHETFGLSIVEGILAGAYPVISKKLPILGFGIMKNCMTFNPNNLTDIKNVVLKAMSANDVFPDRKLVQSFFSWENVAKSHLSVYEG